MIIYGNKNMKTESNIPPCNTHTHTHKHTHAYIYIHTPTHIYICVYIVTDIVIGNLNV